MMDELISREHSLMLLQKTSSLFQGKEFCDVTLISSDGTEHKAHKVVLTAFSGYFFKLFGDGSLMESQRFTFSNISSQSMEDILKYMYTGRLPVTPDTQKEMMETATILEVGSALELLKTPKTSPSSKQSANASSSSSKSHSELPSSCRRKTSKPQKLKKPAYDAPAASETSTSLPTTAFDMGTAEAPTKSSGSHKSAKTGSKKRKGKGKHKKAKKAKSDLWRPSSSQVYSLRSSGFSGMPSKPANLLKSPTKPPDTSSVAFDAPSTRMTTSARKISKLDMASDNQWSFYRCKLCSKEFNSIYKGKVHVRFSHQGTSNALEPYLLKKDAVKRNFDKKCAMIVSQSEDVLVKCGACLALFEDMKLFRKHFYADHFPSLSMSKAEIEQLQSEAEKRLNLPTKADAGQQDDIPELRYSCPLCKSDLKTRNSYRHHLYSKHGLSRKDVDAKYLPKYKCNFKGCPYVALFSGKVAKHTKEKHPGFTIPCPCCDQTFLVEAYLEDHLRNVHPLSGYSDEYTKASERPDYQCYHCKKTFKTRLNYLGHIRKAHAKKFNRVCAALVKNGLQFNQDINYIPTGTGNNHQRYLCNVCHQNFSLYCDIKLHAIACYRNSVKDKCKILSNLTPEIKTEPGVSDPSTGKPKYRFKVTRLKCGITPIERNRKSKYYYPFKTKFRNSCKFAFKRNRTVYQCDACQKIFMNQSTFWKHFAKAHFASQKSGLHESSSEQYMMLSLTSDMNIKIGCPLCGTFCANRSALRKHFYTLHHLTKQEVNRKYMYKSKCGIRGCGYTSLSYRDVEEHCLLHGSEGADIEDETVKELDVRDEEDNLYCPLCKKVVPGEESLETHLTWNHHLALDEIKKVRNAWSKSERRNTSASLLDTNKDSPYSLRRRVPPLSRILADIGRSSVSNVTTPLKKKPVISKEAKVGRLNCPLCQKYFPAKMVLRKHMYVEHELSPEEVTEKYLYKSRCGFKNCDFTSLSVKKVVDHCEEVHPQLRPPYPIEMNERFKESSEKPKSKVVCPICGKLFTARDGLRKHLYDIHNLSSDEVNEKYLYKTRCGVEGCEFTGLSAKVIRDHCMTEHANIKSPFPIVYNASVNKEGKQSNEFNLMYEENELEENSSMQVSHVSPPTQVPTGTVLPTPPTTGSISEMTFFDMRSSNKPMSNSYEGNASFSFTEQQTHSSQNVERPEEDFRSFTSQLLQQLFDASDQPSHQPTSAPNQFMPPTGTNFLPSQNQPSFLNQPNQSTFFPPYSQPNLLMSQNRPNFPPAQTQQTVMTTPAQPNFYNSMGHAQTNMSTDKTIMHPNAGSIKPPLQHGMHTVKGPVQPSLHAGKDPIQQKLQVPKVQDGINVNKNLPDPYSGKSQINTNLQTGQVQPGLYNKGMIDQSNMYSNAAQLQPAQYVGSSQTQVTAAAAAASSSASQSHQTIHVALSELQPDLENTKNQCTLCNSEFSTRNGLRLHLKQSHNLTSEEITKKYMCKYKCKQLGCDFQTLYASHMTRHKETEHRDRRRKAARKLAPESAKQNFLCQKCHCSYTSYRDLKRHFRRKHKSCHFKSVLLLNSVLSRVILARISLRNAKVLYSNGDKNKVIECKKCNKRFQLFSVYKQHTSVCRFTEVQGLVDRHGFKKICKLPVAPLAARSGLLKKNRSSQAMQRKHQDSMQKIACKICFNTLQNLRHYLQHMFYVHKKSNEEVRQFYMYKFMCEAKGCFYGDSKVKSVETHMRIVHPFLSHDCPECGHTFHHRAILENHIYNKHDVGHGSRNKHRCVVCGRGHRNLIAKQIHESKKHDIPHYIERETCVLCQKTFAHKASLKNHMLTHTNDRPISCEYCGMKFKSKPTKDMHIKNVHLDHRPYLCDTCGSSFPTKAHLQTHISKKHGEYKYQCEYCVYGSRVKDYLYTHMFHKHKVRHPDHKRKSYQCPECDYITLIPSRIQAHMNSHTNTRNFECEICGKRYITSSTLKAHKNWAHGSTTLDCPYCNFPAKSKSKFMEHIRIQHIFQDLKPFKCCYCEFTCATSGNTRKHVMKRHPGLEVKYDKDEQAIANATRQLSGMFL